MVPRLKELYLKEIQPALKSKYGFKNLYMGPKIEKIVLNMGLGLDGNDTKIFKSGWISLKYNSFNLGVIISSPQLFCFSFFPLLISN